MKLKCSFFGCREIVAEDEVDCVCFDCGYVFCLCHIDYFDWVTVKDLYERLGDLAVILKEEQDAVYNAEVIVKNLTKGKSDDDFVLCDTFVAIPLCEDCFYNREMDKIEDHSYEYNKAYYRKLISKLPIPESILKSLA